MLQARDKCLLKTTILLAERISRGIPHAQVGPLPALQQRPMQLAQALRRLARSLYFFLGDFLGVLFFGFDFWVLFFTANAFFAGELFLAGEPLLAGELFLEGDFPAFLAGAW